jgi:ankyrin repeat protein
MASLTNLRMKSTSAPNEFECPITHQIMMDPVTADDGHSYEREAIEQWFREHHNRSPITNEAISTNLIDNHALRNVIQDWQETKRKYEMNAGALAGRLCNASTKEKAMDYIRRISELIENSNCVVDDMFLNICRKATVFDETILADGVQATLTALVAQCEHKIHEQEVSMLLYNASVEGDVSKVTEILNREGVDVNSINRNDKGQTALIVASRHGHLSVVEVLLKANGIRVNQGANGGFTAVFIASQEGHLEVVEVLLSKSDIDVNKPNKNGCTPLWMAAQKGHVQIVQTLLTRDDIDVNKPEEDGCTPLWMAAQEGHVQIVQTFLTRDDIDANKQNNRDATPLFIASINGKVEVVRLLLAQPNININKNPDGYSALWMAAQQGHVQIVQTLLTRDDIDVNKPRTTDGSTPLYMAAQEGHVQIVQTLLTTDNIDVNKHNKNNQTPINIASLNGHVEVVRLLLSQPNIDLNKKDDWNDSPLGGAKNNNHTEVVQLLTGAGAQ